MTPGARFDELLQTARADESILRLILYGSRAADTFVYEDSDWDVWLIVRVGAFADYEERYDSDHGDRSRSERTPSTACERIRPRNIAAWDRYAFRHGRCSSTSSTARSARSSTASERCPTMPRRQSPLRRSTPTSTAPTGR